VLDFGSSVGELSHILRYDGEYEFVELDDASADYLRSQNERAKRVDLSETSTGSYDAVFAIDSLEHNTNYAELLAELAKRVAPEGILVLSGPTENFLYRLGRRIAGFEGDYHHTTIADIEHGARRKLRLIASRTVPFGIPLFRVTAWKHP
jgi:2-polyprenyl-3-methyl-5-hydroxy-6-metoxy-1,4-benzoquinol methylase